jgi:CheY-like chemotaxis protein
MASGGDVKVSARAVTFNDEHPPLRRGRYVEVSVTDTGAGIPLQHQSRVFDPFFTTKEKGSGLGLTTSYSIIQRHGGHLEFESEVGSGTTFRFYLPASSAKSRADQENTLTSVSGTARVLVMDDEPSVCDIARIGLSGFGYEVATANGGTEALALYSKALKEGKRFEVVILDLTVRGDIGGKETLERMVALDPEVKAIVASGYSNDPVLARYRDYGFVGMIAKPFRMADLARIISETVSQ